MQVKNPKFEISAVSPKQYPSNGSPEIVLVGKYLLVQVLNPVKQDKLIFII